MSEYTDQIPAIQKAIKEKFGFNSDYFEYVIAGGMHEAGGASWDDPFDQDMAESIMARNTLRVLKISFPKGTLVTRKDIGNFIKERFTQQ